MNAEKKKNRIDGSRKPQLSFLPLVCKSTKNLVACAGQSALRRWKQVSQPGLQKTDFLPVQTDF